MARKGDEVDEAIEEALKGQRLRFPILWMDGGYYVFGTKKTQIKIFNGKLVVKDGVGFIAFREYMDKYYEKEAEIVESRAAEKGCSVGDVVREVEYDEK